MNYQKLSKILFRLGFGEESITKIPAANDHRNLYHLQVKAFLQSLKCLSWKDLRALSEFFSVLDDNSFYESMIFKCDPHLRVTPWLYADVETRHAYQKTRTASKFILTKGYGSKTLNCYRMVELNDMMLFEKVYLSGSDDILKTTWFYDFVYPHLDSRFLKAPKLRAAKFSRRCTILQMDYVILKPLSQRGKALLRAVEITKYLINLSDSIPVNLSDSIPGSANSFLTDFWREPMYKDGIKYAV